MGSGDPTVGGTARLADYLLGESSATAGDDVVTEARHRLVDTLAAITAGSRFEEAATMRDFVDEQFGPGPATVLDGSGAGLTLPGATLVNSLAANVLDVDDGHRLAQGHPAAVIAPAAVAAAEAADRTVGDLIEAFVPAYEIAVRGAMAMHAWTGMHVGSGAWGAVGAGAAVARLRGLPREQVIDALGIAEFNAPITPVMRSVANPASSMTKDGIGWGGYVGMTSALLAERGITGSGTVFDGIEHDGPDASLLDSLGDRYHLLEGYYKPYPACRWVHSGIDAVRELLDAHAVEPSAVREVAVHTHPKGARLGIDRPRTPSEAEYSYPFTIARALRNGGSFTAADLTREARTDEATLDLADRVTLHVDPEAEARYPDESLSRVTLVTTDATYESELVNPRGSRERPISTAELERKWTGQLDGILGDGSAAHVLEAVGDDDRPVEELLASWTDAA